jgi:hypothetical protein
MARLVQARLKAADAREQASDPEWLMHLSVHVGIVAYATDD